MTFLASGFASTVFLSFGVLLEQVMADFTVSSGKASSVYLAQWLAFAAMSLVLGLFSDRWGPSRSIRVGFLVIVLGLLLAFAVSNFVAYVIGFGIMTGAGLSAAYGPVHDLILSATEQARRGLSLGVVTAAHGIGPFLLVPAIASVNQSFGIRNVVGGLFAAAVVLLLLTLLLREGAPVESDDEADSEEPESEKGPRVGLSLTLQSPMGRRENVKAAVGHLVGCVSHAVVLIYIVGYTVRAADVSPVQASTVLSVIALASTASRIFAPVLGERHGGPRLLLALLPLQVVGIVLFIAFADTPIWVYYLTAVVFGVGFGSEMVLFSLIARQLFAGKIGGVLGGQLLGAGVGMGGGPFVAGLMLSAGVSYAGILWFAAAAGVVGVAIVYSMERVSADAGYRLEPRPS